MSNWYKVKYWFYGEILETTMIADSIEMVKERLGCVQIIEWEIL